MCVFIITKWWLLLWHFRVVDHFGELCSEMPQKVRLANTEYTSRMWRYWMTQEPANFNNLLGNGKRLNVFVEVAKKLVGTSQFTLAAIYSLIDAILPQEKEAKVKEYTRKCDEELTVCVARIGWLSCKKVEFLFFCRIYWGKMEYCSITILQRRHPFIMPN